MRLFSPVIKRGWLGKSSINCQWGAFNRTIIYQWGISIATFDYWRRVILKIDFFSGLMKANYMLVDNELKFYDFPKNAQVVYTFGMKLVKPSDLLFEPLCHFCLRWGLAIRVFVTKPNAKPSPMFTKPHPQLGFSNMPCTSLLYFNGIFCVPKLGSVQNPCLVWFYSNRLLSVGLYWHTLSLYLGKPCWLMTSHPQKNWGLIPILTIHRKCSGWQSFVTSKVPQRCYVPKVWRWCHGPLRREPGRSKQ